MMSLISKNVVCRNDLLDILSPQKALICKSVKFPR